jgi:hypothetical protein
MVPLGADEQPHILHVDTTLPDAEHTTLAALRGRDELSVLSPIH